MDGDESLQGAERARTLRAAMAISGLTMYELQVACMGLGDSIGRVDLHMALSGVEALPDRRYDVIAQAINDRLLELGRPDHRLPCSEEVGDVRHPSRCVGAGPEVPARRTLMPSSSRATERT